MACCGFPEQELAAINPWPNDLAANHESMTANCCGLAQRKRWRTKNAALEASPSEGKNPIPPFADNGWPLAQLRIANPFLAANHRLLAPATKIMKWRLSSF